MYVKKCLLQNLALGLKHPCPGPVLIPKLIATSAITRLAAAVSQIGYNSL